MVFKNIFLLIMVSVLTVSCAIWPYKRDFDCPVKEGLKCKSLYEISQMADEGMFGPDADKQRQSLETSKKQKSVLKERGCCEK